MLELIQLNPLIVKWTLISSMVMFVGTLIAVPYLVSFIPDDYFVHEKREPAVFISANPVIKILSILFKNLIGYTLIILGLAMLILPGQGVLTIITGLIFIDFPNKYQMERWLVSRPRVLRTMNWFRKRMNKPPLRLG